jgi:DNA modification methylase
MTTDPGGLVFDPTCGSGTTAYAAEQWVRRWTPEKPRERKKRQKKKKTKKKKKKKKRK